MSYIIAVIIGILIVFNWAPIKTYMDEKIGTAMSQESSAPAEKSSASDEGKATDTQEEASPQKKSKNAHKDEKNSDSFAEFK
jgi:hypothetical protein